MTTPTIIQSSIYSLYIANNDFQLVYGVGYIFKNLYCYPDLHIIAHNSINI